MTQYIFADRVKETTATIGTGAYALAGAVAGFRSFGAGVGNSKSFFYGATNGTDWETGIGTTDATSANISRSVIASSNANAAVNWGAGVKEIWCDVSGTWLNRAAYGTVAVNPDISSSATVAIGSGSAASAIDAIAVGKNSSATNINAVAIGTSANANTTGAVAIGQSAAATNTSSIAINGTASGSGAVALRGTASGAGAVCLGGTTASGAGSVALGKDNQSAVDYGVAIGYGAVARFAGALCLGAEAGGAKQDHRVVMLNTTFNATPTLLQLFAGGLVTYIGLLANKTYAWSGTVIARDTTADKSASWRVEGLLKTDGTGDPTFVGTPTENQLFASAGIGAWAVAAVANTTDNRLDFQITGEASRTIKWFAAIEIQEVY